MNLLNLNASLEQAQRLAQSGQVVQAELLYVGILKDWPGQLQSLRALADLAMQRDDAARAVRFLSEATQRHPNDTELALSYAAVLAKAQRIPEAQQWLEGVVAKSPKFFAAWLFLGQLREATGDSLGALRAWFEAIIGAQRAGQWLGEDTTEPQILEQEIGRASCRERVCLTV